ncbi:S8 family peptidase [Flavobacterium stagni]|uniref:T9SS type A sorting domain-containing protein n=1 Tax=Flavobacterium stagni TaxID=2506421 RepID=A0A4Q1K7H7_9FLAO|nr:S8 family peptidase [Flavobacterium stagni]RXR22122.1 T9SS type A sorting domain-containing protein [Flavobacterium stagni]
MKKLLLFLFPIVAIAQNNEERAFILKQSLPSEINALKAELKFDSIRNISLVNDYVKSHGLFRGLRPERVENGVPFYYQTDNNVYSVQSLNATNLLPGGTSQLGLTGSGINVAIWDGGKVRNTHVEFGNRVTISDGAATLSTHATHVLGTIIASGVNPLRKGFATQSTAYTYDFSSDMSEIEAYAGLGFLMSNHSYGNIASQLAEETFGQYTTQSRQADLIHATYPYYQMVKSAGNDRNDTTLDHVVNYGGYDLLSGLSTAKNILTIGAVNGFTSATTNENNTLASFSNFGPPDDGRVKPDLVGKGVDVNSSISVSDNAYSMLSGTSMSAPSITGLIALLQKHFNNLNPGLYMRSSSVRGLLCHTAQDLGDNVGPDYSFGYGIPDGIEAANLISNRGNGTLMDELLLNQGDTYSQNVQVNTTGNLVFSISWTDPAGTVNNTADNDNRSPRLVNNLDIKVVKDGVTYYPWKLNPDGYFDPATNNSDNDVDNFEKIEIPNATPGIYTIQVNHKGTLSGGSQRYSLLASGTVPLTLSNTLFASDNTFFVYPNPASTEIHFNNPKELTLNSVNIYDITGKLVAHSSSIVNNTVDVSALQSGMYMVKISSENGIFVRKFSKK